jgi:UPF0755 protein
MARKKRTSVVTFLIIAALLGVAAYFLYQKFIIGKIHLKDKTYTYFFIGRDDQFEDVIDHLNSEDIIDNIESFEWLARKMDLDQNVHPGRYRLINGMNMRQIINLLKYDKQERVKLTFNSQIRNLDEFVSYVDEKLELEASEIEDLLTDEKRLYDNFRLDPENCFAMIVPGAVELSWAVNIDEFTKVLKDRYQKIWNVERISQAKKLGFTASEIITIASIVQSESSIESEQEKIAGVYINRLKKNMPLQADPTLKFANRNYDAMRVLDEDKEINSPYNTYRFKGLPPGPICLVTPQAIDATLNYSRHNFIFFCAKPELNGFSDFSSTYEQHRKYALAYQKALDKIGISR